MNHIGRQTRTYLVVNQVWTRPLVAGAYRNSLFPYIERPSSASIYSAVSPKGTFRENQFSERLQKKVIWRHTPFLLPYYINIYINPPTDAQQ